MAKNYIHKSTWQMPVHLRAPLQSIKAAVNELKTASGHPHLKFTLDGRLIGDLGEAIAHHFFEIDLCESLQTGHDAYLQRNGTVQSIEVKIRRESTNIWFDSEPDYLIAFRLEENDQKLTLVYAGPGSVIREQIRNGQEGVDIVKEDENPLGARVRKFKSKQTVSLNQLAKNFVYEEFMANPCIPFRNRPNI